MNKHFSLRHKGRGTSLLLVWVTSSILVVYEASHPKKHRNKDSVKSGQVCTRNVIDTRKQWWIIIRRLSKTSKI